MRYSTEKNRIGIVELTYLLIGALLLLLLGTIAKGQSDFGNEDFDAHAQIQQPLYQNIAVCVSA